ncbi:transposable element Tcb2 transposase [Trichonephila clavipes]|nr:transposable element Tcb2 transposase [Trichonephila clavipes]
MEWPACSPDMNPIEHVWDALGRRVSGRQPPPQTLQELERALLEEWDRIPQLVINSLIDSMPQSPVGDSMTPDRPCSGMLMSWTIENMLYRIEIRKLLDPFHIVNFLFKKIINNAGSVIPHIIVKKTKLRPAAPRKVFHGLQGLHLHSAVQ